MNYAKSKLMLRDQGRQKKFKSLKMAVLLGLLTYSTG